MLIYLHPLLRGSTMFNGISNYTEQIYHPNYHVLGSFVQWWERCTSSLTRGEAEDRGHAVEGGS